MTDTPLTPDNTQHETPQPARRWHRNLPLPGVAAIACLLLFESGIAFFAMLHFLQQRSMIAAPIFVATLLMFCGGAGLLRRYRWGWAIALANALLTACYSLYLAIAARTAQPLIPAALYLVFFFYLIRPTVRIRLR
jgi:Mn2+/Fe2+ NRAMP family transporter